MDFRITCGLPASHPVLTPASRVLMLGSCFAGHVGCRLADALPQGNVDVNPFGVLYNPWSTATALSLLLEGVFPEEDAVFPGKDGLWHSRLHSGDFSDVVRAGCIDKVMNRFNPAAELLKEIDLVCLTWGTAHVFSLCGRPDMVVGNCHKEPGSAYEERRLGVEEIVQLYVPLLEKIHDVRPSAEFVLTVSPYRYARRGLHDSVLTKSILHLATERLCRLFPFVHYFPAYEIVTDELRDYRFYEADMMHPNALAVGYVWERFREWCFAPSLCDYAREKARLLAAERHRPLHPGSKEAQDFARRTAEMRQNMEKKWSRWTDSSLPE